MSAGDGPIRAIRATVGIAVTFPHRQVTYVAVALVISAIGCQVDLTDWDLIFLRPWPTPESSPADLGLTFEDVRIPSTDGTELAAWFLPAQSGKPRGTFLLHTGMEGNIARYLGILPWMAENDFNILVYDWQGFGASEGEPDFDNFEPDTRAAVDYLLARPEPSAHVVIHLGVSLGTIPALSAAADYPDQSVGVIVFGGSFMDQIATVWLKTQVSPLLAPLGNLVGAIWTAMLPDFMDLHDVLDRVHAPILAIVPEDDTTIPPEAQMNLFDALPEPKALYLTFGSHTRAHETDPNLKGALLEWAGNLEGVLPAEP